MSILEKEFKRFFSDLPSAGFLCNCPSSSDDLSGFLYTRLINTIPERIPDIIATGAKTKEILENSGTPILENVSCMPTATPIPP